MASQMCSMLRHWFEPICFVPTHLNVPHQTKNVFHYYWSMICHMDNLVKDQYDTSKAIKCLSIQNRCDPVDRFLWERISWFITYTKFKHFHNMFLLGEILLEKYIPYVWPLYFNMCVLSLMLNDEKYRNS